MSDSLYREFKGLYQALKTLVGLNTFGRVPGEVGVLDWS